jgi:crossover junction endodeoxyribonuclease RuvC
MRILGIDPGIGRMGWGVIETQGSKIMPLGYGCVETTPNSDVSDRLLIVSDQTEKIINEFKPDVLSIEELYFGTNAKTAFSVGQARGVVLLCAAKKKIPAEVYNPMEVKVAVTGYGKAEKNQIGQMVKVILGLESIPKIDDTSDALAVALAHAFSAKLKSKI